MFLFLFLPFLGFSSLITSTNETMNQMLNKNKPILVYVYVNLSNHINQYHQNIFNQVSELFENVDFGYLDCLQIGDKCQEMGINPSTIHMFNSKTHLHHVQFMNEVNIYALCNFVIHG